MLVIISLIADIDQKELVSTNLIDILVFYLRDLPGKVVNGVGRQQLLLGVLDCIFSAVLGYEDAELKFLELEGAFLLIGKIYFYFIIDCLIYTLDLLDQLPYELHGVLLTCLIELTENPRSMSHLMTWRSSNEGITFPQLLVKLWKQEEARIGCYRGNKGELTCLEYPMAGQRQIEGLDAV